MEIANFEISFFPIEKETQYGVKSRGVKLIELFRIFFHFFLIIEKRLLSASY